MSTPESTVYELLAARRRDQNDTVYQFVDYYASVSVVPHVLRYNINSRLTLNFQNEGLLW